MMDFCEGPRGARHEQVVVEGDCPACALHETLQQVEKERDEALDRAVEAETALAKFETDLTHAMRMLRDAKVRAEELEP